MENLCVLPDSVALVRQYLLDVPEVTAITTRISTTLAKDPQWPAVRLTLISSVTVGLRRLDRAQFQIDCFATDQAGAHRLARVIRAALVASANYSGDDGVLGGAVDTAVFPMPDDTQVPQVARYVCSGHVFVASNSPTPA